jgi:hypothetical protein
MSTTHTTTPPSRPLILTALLAVTLTLTLVLMGVVSADGAQAIPTRFLAFSHLGWDVNKTTGGDICTVASGDKCVERAEESGEPGGFFGPESVAVAPNENVYVADSVNDRVQEFTKSGEFVLMFGWDVNKTKVNTPGATQREKNLCTEEEIKAAGVECQTGELGEHEEGLPEQLLRPQDVAVDPTTGDVYVLEGIVTDTSGQTKTTRIEEFTENGEFILMLGGDVNATTGGNICTEQEIKASGVTCKAGVEGTAHGEFKPGGFRGSLLAVGGPEDLLYVGDEGRVQEFRGDGEWVREVSLAGLSPTAKATAIAVDPTGDLFVVDAALAGVHEYNPSGVLQSTVIDPEVPGEVQVIQGVALDAYGRLGILEATELGSRGLERHGVLYTTSGEKVSEFGPIGAGTSLAFSTGGVKPTDLMYVVEPGGMQIETFAPFVFSQVKTCSASAVTATSARLCGEMDPERLAAKAFFAYGTSTGLGSHTPVVLEGSGEAFQSYTYDLSGLLPNQSYDFAAVAEAEVEGEEKQTPGVTLAFRTPGLAPELPGTPVASFVGAQSAVLGGLVNPEHANTTYHFEYAACTRANQSLAECGAEGGTEAQQAGVYGAIGVEQQASGLLPSTSYAFRLVASNAFEYEGKPEGGEATGAEGHFTTGALPTVQASTGPASAVTATGAVVSGSVDPGGQPAAYSFELGVYNGAATRYGVVLSGSVGAVSTPVEESVALTGLQPGTTYAYRVLVHSGYGVATGATVTFTTAGLPAVLSLPVVLAQLPLPPVAFPPAVTVKASTKKLTRAQQLAGALRACAKKAKRRRAVCQRQAHEKYGAGAAKKKQQK